MNVDEAVRRLAPHPGPGLTPGAREMLDQIMETEAVPAVAASGKKWRVFAALPVAAAVGAAAWAVPALLHTPPAAALDIKERGDFWMIEVKDLYANAKVYEDELKAKGIDVILRVAPVTPSRVGEIMPMAIEDQPPGPFIYADKIKTIDRPEKCTWMRSCPVGIMIAKDFSGRADIMLGRKARTGENLQVITGIDTSGEAMHCVPFYNKRVPEMRALLKERGLTVDQFVVGEGDDSKEVASVPDSMYVTGGYMTKGGMVTMRVADEPLPAEVIANRNKKYRC
ncbi:hypothetical protein ABZ897_46820 [Nonomuraea sp. NPDC046802]|uniref:hypothetical protein n=1 Tax=Nonomuraea sp. NPDC046802 TaxID=3154919 RepID=UPI0033CA35C8